jgi:hypothetical protein
VRGWLPPRDFAFTTGEKQMSFEESRNENSREGTQAPTSPAEPLFDEEARALLRIGSAMASTGGGRALRLCADRVIRRLRKRAAAPGLGYLGDLADELSRLSLLMAGVDGADDLTASERHQIAKTRGELAQALAATRREDDRRGGSWPKSILN